MCHNRLSVKVDSCALYISASLQDGPPRNKIFQPGFDTRGSLLLSQALRVAMTA